MTSPRPEPLTDEELARTYRAGASVRQLVAITGRSYNAVYYRLQRLGVPMRPQGGTYRWQRQSRFDLPTNQPPTGGPTRETAPSGTPGTLP
jgi:hypothetical protein